jgi:o-succinylbenzoate synthase
MEILLDHICKLISRGEMDPGQSLPSHPGVRFALETAALDLKTGGELILYSSAFTRGEKGLPINGLVWMGTAASLQHQVREKIGHGYRVLKMKIGALDFNQELEILSWIRAEFSDMDLEIRLDANGAWTFEEASENLDRLAKYKIHSLEQPLAAGQWEKMREICRQSPVPVALDEELIGVQNTARRSKLLEEIQPDYLILKPGLLGGFSQCEDWISLARTRGTGWWVTSALESNIGLNAIAQWTASLDPARPQGLGTGSLYRNNLASPLVVEGDRLWHRPEHSWDLETLLV